MVDGMSLGSALKTQHTPYQSLKHGCLHLNDILDERCARGYALIVLLWLVCRSAAARARLCRRGVVARTTQNPKFGSAGSKMNGSTRIRFHSTIHLQ